MSDLGATTLPRRDALPFLPLIAAAPVLFAILTIPYLGAIWPLANFLRFFSTPVTMIELIVILLAALRGVDIFGPLRSERLWVKLALVTLCAVAVGTAIAAVGDPLSAYLRTFAWGVHLFFGLSVSGIARKFWLGREQEIWPWLIAGLLAYLVTLVAFVVSLGDAREFNWLSFGLGVINVRQLGFYSAAGFSVAISLALLTEERKMRWLYTAAAAAMIALSFWSGTRSSILSSFAALIFCAAVIRELRTVRTLALAAAAFAAGAALSAPYDPPIPEMGLARIFTDSARDGANKMTSSRVETWMSTARSVTHRPLFGYGESQFKTTEPTAQNLINHPHNMELQFLYQWGFLGGGAFLALTALLFWRLIGAARLNAQHAVPSLLIVTNMLAMAQIEGSMYHPYPVMTAVFALAFALALPDREMGTSINRVK